MRPAYFLLIILVSICFSDNAHSQGVSRIKQVPSLMEESYISGIAPVEPAKIAEYIKVNSATAEGKFMIGYSLMQGKDTFAQAEKWLLSAEKEGSAKANVALGRLYKLLERDNEAKSYFSRAQKAGNPEGYYEMGEIYEKGELVLADFKRALEYYNFAAQKGVYNAIIKLALYSEMLNRKDLALSYYESAIRIAQGQSQKNQLTYIISNLLIEVAKAEQDRAKALIYYKKAGAMGNMDAQYEVATAYEKGEGLPKDFKKALEMYQAMINAGHAPSMTRMGKLYYDGIIFKRNFGKAFEWFTKAGELGDPLAAYYISDMYRNGRGVKKDHNKAEEWQNRSNAMVGGEGD